MKIVINIFVLTALLLLAFVLGGKYYPRPIETRYQTYTIEVPFELPHKDKPLHSKPGKRDTINVFDWRLYDSMAFAIGDSVWALAVAESYITEFEDSSDGNKFYARTVNRPMYRDAILDSLYITPRKFTDSSLVKCPELPEPKSDTWTRIKYFIYGAAAVYIYERLR